MCVAKKPSVGTDPTSQKDPPILRNSILDGMLGNIAALRGGRNALRIDLLNPLAIPVGGGIGGGSGIGGGGSGGSSSSGADSGGGGGSGGTTTRTSSIGTPRTGLSANRA